MMSLAQAQKAIRNQRDPKRANFLMRFFKTGRGEYAENDKFLGLSVPQTRLIAKQYAELPLNDVVVLLKSEFHEERLMALFIMIGQYDQAKPNFKSRIIFQYLKHIKNFVNNWDLVDASSYQLLGRFLFEHQGGYRLLFKLARSSNL